MALASFCPGYAMNGCEIESESAAVLHSPALRRSATVLSQQIRCADILKTAQVKCVYDGLILNPRAAPFDATPKLSSLVSETPEYRLWLYLISSS